ncbi:MAG: sulfurtransferase [Chromatiales bacterium]|jgi:thiosulfate/3-mercaptopyruvate sulfurtransferase|nr:sulfurtransferase [Chromatiales bacterium]
MNTPRVPVFIQAEELAALRSSPKLAIADLSAAPSYAMEHIPGAVHIPAARLSMARPPVMGLLPPEEEIAEVLGEAGITPDSYVIAYDAESGLNASRFLWTLDLIGHTRFSMLDGGLRAWVNAGQETTSDEPDIVATEYRAHFRDEHRADKAWITAHLGNPDMTVLDSRTAAEYHGTDRRAARGGHIPGAINIDWSLALRGGGDLRLRASDELRALFMNAGIRPEHEIVTHCHTHLRSSHAYLVLKMLGYPRLRGYPGSWSDWGNDPNTAIE